MKKVMILMLVVVLLFTGCADKSPIKIGYIAGLSGTMSELGVAGRNAFLLKVDEVNAAGGINGRLIEAVVKDSESNPDLIPGLYNELREEEVEFVVGHILSSMASSVLDEAAKEDILIISATMSTNLIDNRDDYLLRTAVSNSFQATRMAKQLNDDGKNNIIVVTDQRNATYTEEFAQSMVDEYKGEMTIMPYDATDELTDSIYNKVEEMSPDGVLMITPAIDTATMAQRIKQIGDIDLYSVSWSMSTDLIHNGADSVEGMKIVYFDNNDLYSAERNEFKKKYLEKYNEEAIFVSDIVYEASTILMDQMASVDDLSPQAVKDSIVGSTFEGIEDNVSFNEYGDRPGEYQIFIVEDGEFNLMK